MAFWKVSIQGHSISLEVYGLLGAGDALDQNARSRFRAFKTSIGDLRKIFPCGNDADNPRIERNFLVFSSRYLIGSELCFRKRHRRCLCRMVCWLEMEIKEMAWCCGNECKGADCRNSRHRIKVRQCLVHRQEEKGNSENGFTNYDGGNRRKIAISSEGKMIVFDFWTFWLMG